MKMNITDVRIRCKSTAGNVKAIASVTLGGEFVVHDIKLIEGNKGLFIAMPSRAVQDYTTGKMVYRDIAHPINSESRNELQEAIIQKYKEELENEQ